MFVHNTGQQIQCIIGSLKCTGVGPSNNKESSSISDILSFFALCALITASNYIESVSCNSVRYSAFPPLVKLKTISCRLLRNMIWSNFLFVDTMSTKTALHIEHIIIYFNQKKSHFVNFTPFFLICGQNVQYYRLSGSQESPLLCYRQDIVRQTRNTAQLTSSLSCH